MKNNETLQFAKGERIGPIPSKQVGKTNKLEKRTSHIHLHEKYMNTLIYFYTDRCQKNLRDGKIRRGREGW